MTHARKYARQTERGARAKNLVAELAKRAAPLPYPAWLYEMSKRRFEESSEEEGERREDLPTVRYTVSYANPSMTRVDRRIAVWQDDYSRRLDLSVEGARILVNSLKKVIRDLELIESHPDEKPAPPKASALPPGSLAMPGDGDR